MDRAHTSMKQHHLDPSQNSPLFFPKPNRYPQTNRYDINKNYASKIQGFLGSKTHAVEAHVAAMNSGQILHEIKDIRADIHDLLSEIQMYFPLLDGSDLGDVLRVVTDNYGHKRAMYSKLEDIGVTVESLMKVLADYALTYNTYDKTEVDIKVQAFHDRADTISSNLLSLQHELTKYTPLVIFDSLRDEFNKMSRITLDTKDYLKKNDFVSFREFSKYLDHYYTKIDVDNLIEILRKMITCSIGEVITDEEIKQYITDYLNNNLIGNIAYLDTANTFTAVNNFSGGLAVNGDLIVITNTI